ncbi:MAG: translation initiation factor IF-2 [Candidatus Berkelbacteria bacterium Licking1014_7]|uniref:Translation initiation factor IF-2 n=1 Tax=Candidatus Berkelbacteria bacterium Licking1014_7 TaxID=2017147 RepID=A0A554LL92_9BACT|nr:MAG: translation initiation factor IF-2 [Candidatus Berkelbacteria bacterium Licking1014_7]
MKPKRKFSKKELKAQARENSNTAHILQHKTQNENHTAIFLPDQPKQKIALSKIITVRDFAQKLDLPVQTVIMELMKNGVMANINESIDFETGQIIALELGFETENEDTNKKEKDEEVLKDGYERPPIVIVMGHVDHGKTKLLDVIRKTDVVSGESGAITQHIGAYQVEVALKDQKRAITFLDTPGHEAFSSLRAHGANLTDIVVLVVAANDGIKPQTVEAISHAKSAAAPIIVAINKIDLPEADPEKVKRQLAEINLLPEEWGGKIPTVEISAAKNQNLDKLLELIILVADMLELKTTKKGLAQGAVIESKTLKGFGPVATVLVQKGELNIGDIITVGKTWAKVKAMYDWRGNKLLNVSPSMPALVAGFRSMPETGEIFQEQKDEKIARQKISQNTKYQPVKSIHNQGSDSNISTHIIIKADMAGSLKAIEDKIKEIDQSKIKVEIIVKAVGAITETDVNLAEVSQAWIIGFKSTLTPEVRKLAQEKKVSIRNFDIIYELLDYVYGEIEKILPPEIEEKIIGRAKVLKTFHQFKTQVVAGLEVIEGEILPDTDANQWRDHRKMGKVKLKSLELEKQTVKVLKTGATGGAKLVKKSPFAKVKKNDIIETYQIIKKEQKLRRGR